MISQDIIKLFLYEEELSFSAIAKRVGERTNLVEYHLEHRVTKQFEQYIPYIQDDHSPLPVVLVGIVESKILLMKRSKRPYKGLWSMPGGRIKLGERVENAAKRIAKQKVFVDVKDVKVLGSANEIFYQDEVAHHGFVLLIVTCRPVNTIVQKDDVRWFDQIPKDTIISDAFYADKLLRGEVPVFKEFEVE